MIDFHSYWREVRADLAAVPADWERTERDQTVSAHGKTWRIDWVRFSSIDDGVIEAWCAVPLDHPINGVGFLWLPGYSYGTPPPDKTNLVTGCVTLCLNLHGNAPDAPYVNPAGKNDYILEGIDDPCRYLYRTLVAHCLRAGEVLAAQPELNPGRMAVGGMSQGGGLALIVAAQDRRYKICLADMPFLSDIPLALEISHSPAYRTLKHYLEQYPETAGQALATVRLFDPVVHAPLIHVPTWLTAGGKDPACKPPTVESVFAALGTSEKEYTLFPQAGHVFVPEMNAAHHAWIMRYLLQVV